MTKIWMITGASSGFGAAFARHALGSGDAVVLTARRRDRLEALAATAPDRALAVAMDVTDPASVAAAVQQAEARFGRIDVLINNAGYGIVGAVEETSDAELRALMETNFFGAFTVTNAVLPGMRARRAGAIVMISSMGGQMSFAGFGPYSASKFAMEGLTEALAQEVGPLGIKAMIVEPGQFRTEFAGSALRHMPRIDDYTATVEGTRELANGMDGTQPGDPAKAAAVIARALEAKTTPLRLVLGEDAVDGVRDHAEALLAELAQWESTGRLMAVDR